MQIGIIGTGHMGGMLARAFSETSDEPVFIYNRTPAKAKLVASGYPNIQICPDLVTLVKNVDVVCLSTKGPDGLAVIEEIGPLLTRDQLLVTTISGISLATWPEFTRALPVKLIPSLTQTVHRGVLLLCYPPNFPAEIQERLERRLTRIGQPFVVQEDQLRVASDLASCGPAFLSTICQAWATEAANTGKLDRQTAAGLLREMMIGTAALLESGMTFDSVVEQIKVPGGVTERGIDSMEDAPNRLFSRLHEETASHSHGAKKKSVVNPMAGRRG